MSKKQKPEKMKSAVAGSYLPGDIVDEIVEAVSLSDMSEEFQQGVMFMLAFLSCDEGCEMHGERIEDFLENGRCVLAALLMPPEVRHAVRGLIDHLESLGITVGEVSVVEGSAPCL